MPGYSAQERLPALHAVISKLYSVAGSQAPDFGPATTNVGDSWMFYGCERDVKNNGVLESPEVNMK